MIVTNIGYLSVQQVQELIASKEVFSIYKTPKDTEVLVKNTTSKTEYLCSPKKDRLPYKITEGKKIINGCVQVFNSKTDDESQLDTSNWNNGNQIMSYEPFTINY
jgi:hypothetical protein